MSLSNRAMSLDFVRLQPYFRIGIYTYIQGESVEEGEVKSYESEVRAK